MRPGSILIGFLNPYQGVDRALLLCEKKITSFAVELIPRISRAQSMDALTSQATVAGYQCALIAGVVSPKFFPMITYAAGTLRPARVLIIGAGVAGLQAIATVHRLGAIAEAYDVRQETREQVESLAGEVRRHRRGSYVPRLRTRANRRRKEESEGKIGKSRLPGRCADYHGCDSRQKKSAHHHRRHGAGNETGLGYCGLAADSGGNVAGSRPG